MRTCAYTQLGCGLREQKACDRSSLLCQHIFQHNAHTVSQMPISHAILNKSDDEQKQVSSVAHAKGAQTVYTPKHNTLPPAWPNPPAGAAPAPLCCCGPCPGAALPPPPNGLLPKGLLASWPKPASARNIRTIGVRLITTRPGHGAWGMQDM